MNNQIEGVNLFIVFLFFFLGGGGGGRKGDRIDCIGN